MGGKYSKQTKPLQISTCASTTNKAGVLQESETVNPTETHFTSRSYSIDNTSINDTQRSLGALSQGVSSTKGFSTQRYDQSKNKKKKKNRRSVETDQSMLMPSDDDIQHKQETPKTKKKKNKNIKDFAGNKERELGPLNDCYSKDRMLSNQGIENKVNPDVESQEACFANQSTYFNIVDKETQTDDIPEKTKGKVKKEIKQRNTTIKEMTNVSEILAGLCRNPSADLSVDGYDCSVCPDDFSRNMRYIEKYITNLNLVQSERDMYLNRLSEVAGDKLASNNPNIANLNDPKRPTKLAEQFKDVYDNEWTDAMEKLEKTDGNPFKCVYHLFSVLKIVYHACRQKADIQLKRMSEHLLLLNSPSQEQIEETWKDCPTEKKRILDSRKVTADRVILQLQKTLPEDEVFLQQVVECSPTLEQEALNAVVASEYFDKCVDLCWRFVIQDPPLYVETDIAAGNALDKNLYSEYTRSGKFIDYVVWPPLYLYHKDCKNAANIPPLLAKGVAQGKNG